MTGSKIKYAAERLWVTRSSPLKIILFGIGSKTTKDRPKRRTERSIGQFAISDGTRRSAHDSTMRGTGSDLLRRFERPRKTAGGEIADSFDSSSPAVHRHLQTGPNELSDLPLAQDRRE